MVDSPYFRPPEDLGSPERSVHKVRRAAGAAPEPDVWVVVWSSIDDEEVGWAAATAQDAGIATWVRRDGDTVATHTVGTGPSHVSIAGSEFELLVPETEAELAGLLLEEAYERDGVEDDLAPEPPDDPDEPFPGYWTLRDDIDRQMAGATRSQRDRAYARARARLDPAFAERRRTRRLALLGLVVLVLLLVAFVGLTAG